MAQGHKRPLLGLRRPWSFYEKAVGSACRNVRFQVFLIVTFDTLPPLVTVRYLASNSVDLISPNDPFRSLNLINSLPETGRS